MVKVPFANSVSFILLGPLPIEYSPDTVAFVSVTSAPAVKQKSVTPKARSKRGEAIEMNANGNLLLAKNESYNSSARPYNLSLPLHRSSDAGRYALTPAWRNWQTR